MRALFIYIEFKYKFILIDVDFFLLQCNILFTNQYSTTAPILSGFFPLFLLSNNIHILTMIFRRYLFCCSVFFSLNITVFGCEFVIKTNTYAHVNDFIVSWKKILFIRHYATTHRNVFSMNQRDKRREGERMIQKMTKKKKKKDRVWRT